MTSNNILQPSPPKTKYLVYQITNLINNKIYVGVHACDCKDCKYMGSGKELNKEYKKIGKENFIKEILFEFNNKEDMLAKEKEIVNDFFLRRKDTYNMIVGGGGLITKGFVTVKDNKDTFFFVSVDDPRYVSGELIHISKRNGICKR